MSCFRSMSFFSLGLTLVFLSQYACAQDSLPSVSAITAIGSVSKPLQPTALRMRVVLTEKDTTAAAAIQKLTDRKEAVRLQLESLGSKEGSIEISAATFPAQDSEMEQQMRQMAMFQMQRSGRVPEGLKPVESVTVTCNVTAEWELDAEDNAKMLEFVADIKNKVIAADPAGLNEPKQLTPEEEEMMAEMQEMNYYGQETAQPGEPSFLFVATISDEARAKAQAEAFAKAKKQAQGLADAAGVGLGRLISLTSSGSDSASSYASQYMYMQYAYGMGGDPDSPTPKENEAVAVTPDGLALRVMLNAAFTME